MFDLLLTKMLNFSETENQIKPISSNGKKRSHCSGVGDKETPESEYNIVNYNKCVPDIVALIALVVCSKM